MILLWGKREFTRFSLWCHEEFLMISWGISHNHEEFLIMYVPVTFMAYRLSFPGCCWMSSSRYFLANNIKPFMGRFGLSQSFSFLLLAGEFTPCTLEEGDGGGGDPLRCSEGICPRVCPTEVGGGGTREVGWKANAVPWIARGDSVSVVEEVNSKRLNLSQRSGVRMASGWFGGRQISPVDNSWHLMP